MSGMNLDLVFSLFAFAAVLPVGLAAYAGAARRDIDPGDQTGGGQHPGGFWLWMALAVLGPVTFAGWLVADGWPRDVAGALWVTVAGTALVLLWVCIRYPTGWRLAALASPLMALLAGLAVLWRQAGGAPEAGGAELGGEVGLWTAVHIAASVLTYALVTVAAVAALAVLVKVRSLRRKTPGRLANRLPAIAEAERIQLVLLKAAAAVLGAGIVTGLALEFGLSGAPISFTHKYLFSVIGFVVICGLIFANARSGVRGRQGARTALVAWVLLTLGYLGVKFVTDVVLA